MAKMSDLVHLQECPKYVVTLAYFYRSEQVEIQMSFQDLFSKLLVSYVLCFVELHNLMHLQPCN